MILSDSSGDFQINWWDSNRFHFKYVQYGTNYAAAVTDIYICADSKEIKI